MFLKRLTMIILLRSWVGMVAYTYYLSTWEAKMRVWNNLSLAWLVRWFPDQRRYYLRRRRKKRRKRKQKRKQKQSKTNYIISTPRIWKARVGTASPASSWAAPWLPRHVHETFRSHARSHWPQPPLQHPPSIHTFCIVIVSTAGIEYWDARIPRRDSHAQGHHPFCSPSTVCPECLHCSPLPYLLKLPPRTSSLWRTSQYSIQKAGMYDINRRLLETA